MGGARRRRWPRPGATSTTATCASPPQLLNHAVFADPDDTEARKELLAEVYERLGHGAENGTWRNFYLMGAQELRDGVVPPPTSTLASPDMVAALTVEQLFDSLAIRVDGPKAWNESLAIDWHFTDLSRALPHHAVQRRPHPPGRPATGEPADLTLTLTKPQLLGLLAGRAADGIEHEGDMSVLRRLIAVLDDPDPDFAIVTP